MNGCERVGGFQYALLTRILRITENFTFSTHPNRICESITICHSPFDTSFGSIHLSVNFGSLQTLLVLKNKWFLRIWNFFQCFDDFSGWSLCHTMASDQHGIQLLWICFDFNSPDEYIIAKSYPLHLAAGEGQKLQELGSKTCLTLVNP